MIVGKRYTLMHYKRIARGAYDVTLCSDDGSCEKLHTRGIMIHLEIVNGELDEEASINIENGSIYMYYEYDACRTRRYVEIELDQDRDQGRRAVAIANQR